MLKKITLLTLQIAAQKESSHFIVYLPLLWQFLDTHEGSLFYGVFGNFFTLAQIVSSWTNGAQRCVHLLGNE
jgi:hypothetical protein